MNISNEQTWQLVDSGIEKTIPQILSMYTDQLRSSDLLPTQEEYTLPFVVGTKISGLEVQGPPTHEGTNAGSVDFLVPDGTPVTVPVDGTLFAVDVSHNEGGNSPDQEKNLNYLVIQTPSGQRCLLAHLAPDSVHIPVGAFLHKGESIAITGSTGRTDKPHLHMQVMDVFSEKKYVTRNIQFAEPTKEPRRAIREVRTLKQLVNALNQGRRTT